MSLDKQGMLTTVIREAFLGIQSWLRIDARRNVASAGETTRRLQGTK